MGGVGGKHRAFQAQSDMGMIRLGKSNEFFGANFMDNGIVSLQNIRIATKLELKELFRVFEILLLSGIRSIYSQPQYMVVRSQQDKGSEMTCAIEFSAR